MITACERHHQADERTCTDCVLEMIWHLRVRSIHQIMTEGPLNVWR
jgi:hypothetical protein